MYGRTFELLAIELFNRLLQIHRSLELYETNHD